VRVFVPRGGRISRLRRRLRRWSIARDHARYLSGRSLDAGHFADDRCEYGEEVIDQIPPCDVATIHSMEGVLDYRALGALARRAHIVRVLHAMEFFTGGCDYDLGCGRFAARCGACPRLGSSDPRDLSSQSWLRRRAAIAAVPRGRLWLVAPSRWIAGEAKRSSLARDLSVTVIPNGIDTDVFKARDRLLAREVFGIPADARVVLFVAEWMYRPAKGVPVLAAALREMADVSNVMLVSVGTGRPAVDIPIPHLKLPAIRNERLLSFAYSAADVLAIPSLQENFPFVVLEAMACGFPVVGSHVGGIAEQIRPGVNGLLVPAGDPAALRGAILRLLQDPAMRGEMSREARRSVLAEYTVAQHVRRHVDLYEAIVSNRAEATAPATSRGPDSGP
jgi:glycosyltransferase involved in cell wall biosynthesis